MHVGYPSKPFTTHCGTKHPLKTLKPSLDAHVPVTFVFTDVGDEMSRVCVVRAGSINQPRRDLAPPDQDSPLLPSEEDKPTLEQVTVKQEKPEEETDGSACCLDSIKVEDFSPECMLAVQSKMLEEWKPEVPDIHSQDSITPLSCSGLAQGKKLLKQPQNVNSSSKTSRGSFCLE